MQTEFSNAGAHCARILRSNFGAGIKRKCPTWGLLHALSFIVLVACRNEQKTVRLGCCNSHQILGTLYDLPYPVKLINHGINTNGGREERPAVGSSPLYRVSKAQVTAL